MAVSEYVLGSLKPVALVYVIWIGMLYFMQDKMIFPTYAIPDVTNSGPPPGMTAGYIDGEEGARIEYWITDDPSHAPTIVVFHGNAELIDFIYPSLKPLKDMGYNLLLPEYRGYGRSTGAPSQDLIQQDMKTIIDQLARTGQIDKGNLIFMGTSLGGGIAFNLAREISPRAIMVRSTFASVKRMARRYLAPSFLIKNPFDSLAVAKSYSGPIFIAHGKNDRTIPFSHGEELHEVSKNSDFYTTNSDHNDFPLDREYWRVVRDFLENNKLLP